MKPPPPDRPREEAEAGLTATADDEPTTVAASEAVIVCAPALFRAAVNVWTPASAAGKVYVPASAAVNVYESICAAAGDPVGMATVPVNPLTGLPVASTAVTVTANGVPAVAVVGALICRPVAPARLVAALVPLTSTSTL